MSFKIISSLTILCGLMAVGFSYTVDLREDYRLTWELEGEDTITFELEVGTLGYIGFGFARGTPPVMEGADIVIAGVNGSDGNNGYLRDRHGVGHSLPLVDEQQDYTYIESSENATHTRVKFSRLLNTCDNDDVEILPNSMNIIWSFGLDDGLNWHTQPNHGDSVMDLLPGFTGHRRVCDAETTTLTPESTEANSSTVRIPAAGVFVLTLVMASILLSSS